MDKEDRDFIRNIGPKAVRLLKQKNPKLFIAFNRQCEQGGANPDYEMGRLLLDFAYSFYEDGSFADEIMSKTVRLNALDSSKDKEGLADDVKYLIELRNQLKGGQEDETDKLINNLLSKAFEETKSPMDKITSEAESASSGEEETIRIDDKLLKQLSEEDLRTLSSAANEIADEKRVSQESSSDDLFGKSQQPQEIEETEEDYEEKLTDEEQEKLDLAMVEAERRGLISDESEEEEEPETEKEEEIEDEGEKITDANHEEEEIEEVVNNDREEEEEQHSGESRDDFGTSEGGEESSERSG